MTPRQRIENLGKYKAGDVFTVGDVVSYTSLKYEEAVDALRELRDDRKIAKVKIAGAKQAYYQVRRPSLLLKKAWDRNLDWGGAVA